ncbi:MAG: hypothetical protein ACREFW_05250, partial [Rhizomicrobium sp.]
MADKTEIGEPLAEADLAPPRQEDCACKQGMFPRASRRQILRGGGLLTAVGALFPSRPVLAQDADGDAPWTVPGRIAKSDYGTRSRYETVTRLATPAGTDALTPL